MRVWSVGGGGLGGCYGIDGEDRGVVEGEGGPGAPIHPLYFRRRFPRVLKSSSLEVRIGIARELRTYQDPWRILYHRHHRLGHKRTYLTPLLPDPEEGWSTRAGNQYNNPHQHHVPSIITAHPGIGMLLVKFLSHGNSLL